MKASLILTYSQLSHAWDFQAVKDDNLGYVPPISLLTVASILEKEGIEVQVIDMDAEQLSYDQTLEKLRRFSPDLLGFTLSTYTFAPILKYIKQFKKDTSLPIIVGGVQVALYPEETFSHEEIDYLLIGEAEIPLPQFIRAFERGQGFEGIKSIGYRENGRVIIDTTKQYVKNVDDNPWPARHLINNELYYNILTKRKNFTAMISARGCPYRCTFCDQKATMYRNRSPRSFVDEIKYNVQSFGIHEFDIYDSTFTANKKRVLEICELITTEKVDVSWTIRSRVDSVNNEVLKALKLAGCHTIMYGIESSNEEILKKMNKDISVAEIRRIINESKQIGLDLLGFFMFGYPGETRETIEETIAFSLDLPLDYAQYAVMVPQPNTEIYEYYMKRWGKDFWAEYTLDTSINERIELVDTEVTRQEASELLRVAYKKFFYRPKIILNRLFKLRSFGELIRMAKGAWGIRKPFS